MTINEFQQKTREFDLYPKENKVISLTLGLTSEAGEVADKMKKIIRDKQGQFSEEDVFAVITEISDVMWYAVRIADELGFTAEKVLKINIEKLTARKQKGMLSGSGDNR